MATISPETLQKIKQAMKEQDTKFIEDRFNNEQRYNAFIKALLELPEEYVARLDVPIDPRPYNEVFSSLFRENITFEEYRAEVNANLVFLKAVDKLRAEVTEEALVFYNIK